MEFERILFDIETQKDFFIPGGSLFTPDASSVARNIYRLFGWAKRYEIPVISTVLRVRRNERGPFDEMPHLIEGTDGESKLARTILPRRINLGLRNSTDLPVDIFEKYQQVIFEKRDTNIFNHVRLERLLTELRKATFIICGADMGHGISQAAVGLRNRGFSIIVAEDAVLSRGGEMSDMARLRMEAKGAIFAKTSELIIPRPKRRRAAFKLDLSIPNKT